MEAKELVKKFGWGRAKQVLLSEIEGQTHFQVEENNFRKCKKENDVWFYWFDYMGVLKWNISEGYELMVSRGHKETCLANMVELCDLKTLVDAWELVEKFGGLKRAKRILKKSYKTWGMCVSVVWNDKPFQCSLQELDQAIELVESCNV